MNADVRSPLADTPLSRACVQVRPVQGAIQHCVCSMDSIRNAALHDWTLSPRNFKLQLTESKQKLDVRHFRLADGHAARSIQVCMPSLGCVCIQVACKYLVLYTFSVLEP